MKTIYPNQVFNRIFEFEIRVIIAASFSVNQPMCLKAVRWFFFGYASVLAIEAGQLLSFVKKSFMAKALKRFLQFNPVNNSDDKMHFCIN